MIEGEDAKAEARVWGMSGMLMHDVNLPRSNKKIKTKTKRKCLKNWPTGNLIDAFHQLRFSFLTTLVCIKLTKNKKQKQNQKKT